MTVEQQRDPRISLAISWNGDGTFAGDHDEVNSTADPRLLTGTLSTTRGRNAPRGSAGAQASTMRAGLLNEDRLFSNEYPGSDLYLQVEPGRPTRVRFETGASILYDEHVRYDEAIPYDGLDGQPIVAGFLQEPEADSSLGHKVLSISMLGKLSTLRDVEISTTLYTAITTGAAIGHVLDAAGWPAAERSIAVGDTTISYWWLDKADAMDALDDLLATEGVPAALYESALGYVVFENRLYRANTTRSLVSQATFLDHIGIPTQYDGHILYDEHVLYEGGSGLYHQQITVAPSRADIVNEAKVRIVRRVAQSLQKVWEYGEALILGGNETRDIEAPFSDPVSGLLAPVLATDYSLGAGTLASTPTLQTTYAQRAVVRFVAGVGGATVNGVTSNGPQLRAQPVAVLSEETVTDDVVARDIDQPPPLGRGIKSKTIQALPELSKSAALSVANAEVLYSRDPRPVVTFEVRNIDGAHLRQQVKRDISDRVTALSSHHGFALGSELTIEQIEHQRQAGILLTTFVCQRAFAEQSDGVWASSDSDTFVGVALWGSDASDVFPGVGQWSP